MEKQTLDFLIAKTKELTEAFSCCQELKDAANDFLDSIATDKEKEMVAKYLQEIEEDIMPIDTLIAFASSEAGTNVFGKEKTIEVADHAKEIKANGAIYCDCPACLACKDILEKKDEILK